MFIREKKKKYIVGVDDIANNSQFCPLHTQFSKSVVFLSLSLLQIIAMTEFYHNLKKTVQKNRYSLSIGI